MPNPHYVHTKSYIIITCILKNIYIERFMEYNKYDRIVTVKLWTGTVVVGLFNGTCIISL